MKKIISLILITLMVFALCGCELDYNISVGTDNKCSVTSTTKIRVDEVSDEGTTEINGKDVKTLPKQTIDGVEYYVDTETKTYNSTSELVKEMTTSDDDSDPLFKSFKLDKTYFKGELSEAASQLSAFGLIMDFSITLPYEIKNTNCVLSIDNKTATFNLSQPSIYAYTSNYVAKVSINKAKVTGISTKTYTGKNRTQNIKVVLNKKTLKKGTDYTVTYKNNKKVGLASITIIGKGNYEGSINKTFKIVPKTTSLKSVKGSTKKLTIKWKKQTSQTSGYQIQYSTSKKFKSAKLVTVKKNKTTSTTIKKLKAKKTYYVRVRTYKTVSGKKYCSSWSKVKTTKIK